MVTLYGQTKHNEDIVTEPEDIVMFLFFDGGM